MVRCHRPSQSFGPSCNLASAEVELQTGLTRVVIGRVCLIRQATLQTMDSLFSRLRMCRMKNHGARQPGGRVRKELLGRGLTPTAGSVSVLGGQMGVGSGLRENTRRVWCNFFRGAALSLREVTGRQKDWRQVQENHRPNFLQGHS